MDLSGMHPKELLSLYARVLDELRRQGIIRSTNNPAADYAEHLVSRALRLEIAGKSNAGYDAIDSNNERYQIKGRRITSHNKSRQLSFIRGLEEGKRPFEYLAGVLFAEDFPIFRACVIPLDAVRLHSKHVPHVNGWRFVLHDKIWALPNVKDITDNLKEHAKRSVTEGI